MTVVAAVADPPASVVVDLAVQQWCVRTRPGVLLTAAGHGDRARQLASAAPQHVAAVLAAVAPEVLTSREQPNRQLAAIRDQERTRNAFDVWEALADATWTQTASSASYLLFGGVAAGVVPPRALLQTFSLSRPRAEREQATSPTHQPRLGSWLGWDIAWDVAADAVATVAWRAVVDLASPAGPVWRGQLEHAWVAARDVVISALTPAQRQLDASLVDVTTRRPR